MVIVKTIRILPCMRPQSRVADLPMYARLPEHAFPVHGRLTGAAIGMQETAAPESVQSSSGPCADTYESTYPTPVRSDNVRAVRHVYRRGVAKHQNLLHGDYDVQCVMARSLTAMSKRKLNRARRRRAGSESKQRFRTTASIPRILLSSQSPPPPRRPGRPANISSVHLRNRCQHR